MLKLKLQSLAHLIHWKRPWCWERLKVGGEEDDRGWDGRMASLTNGHEFEQAPGLGDGQGSLVCGSPWVAKSWTRLSDWTEVYMWVFSPNDHLAEMWAPECCTIFLNKAWQLQPRGHDQPDSCFRKAQSQECFFTFVNGWKRIKSRIWFVTQNIGKIQISVSIKKI